MTRNRVTQSHQKIHRPKAEFFRSWLTINCFVKTMIQTRNFISAVIVLCTIYHTQAMYESGNPTRVFVATPRHPPLQENGKFFCPAEGKDLEILQKFVQNKPNILSTLIPKTPVPDQETLCIRPVEPILDRGFRKLEGWKVDKKYDIYFLCFQLWYLVFSPSEYYETAKESHTLPTEDVVCSPVYDIVYDYFLQRALLTRHQISSSEYITNYQALQNQITNSVYELSTESFCFEDKQYFKRIINTYQSHNEDPANRETILQKLVPEQDLPPVRNKATKHVINTAPLWNKLAMLMAVINNGIQRADVQIKRKFFQINNVIRKFELSGVHELIIYTRLLYFPKDLNKKDKINIPDVWCKFVYYSAKKLGILIYVHNTESNPPEEKDKYCTADKRLNCNFNNWIENNGHGIENAQYAYCCSPSPKKIKEYFWIEKTFEGILDIEKIALGYDDVLSESTSNPEQDDQRMEENEAVKRLRIEAIADELLDGEKLSL